MLEDEGWKHLIGHADRLWKAEEQNASRLAARANLVLSGIAAVIGLKVYAVGKEFDTILNAPIGWRTVFFWQCSVVSLICIGVALWLVLDIRGARQTKSSTASQKLWLDKELLGLATKNGAFPTEYAAEMVFSATYAAASDLQDRNARRGKAVSGAQLLFFLGVSLLFVSMVLYASLRSDEIDHAGTHEQPQHSASVSGHDGPRSPDPEHFGPGTDRH